MKTSNVISMIVLLGLTLVLASFSTWLSWLNSSPSTSKEEYSVAIASQTISNLETATDTLVPVGNNSTDTDPQIASRSWTVTTPPHPTGESFAATKKTYMDVRVSHNGLKAELREIDLNPDYPTITVCTDIPTIADWLPRFSAVHNGQRVGVWGWMLIDPDNIAYQKTNRCYLVHLTPSTAPKDFSGEFVLSLDYFETSIPERIPEDLIVRAKDRLRSEGIDFQVENIPKGVNLVITKKPDSCSEAEALQKVKDALTDRAYGPWTFTIVLEQE